MKLLKSIDLALGKKLKDPEYRNVFFEEWATDEVAEQIRRLRKFRRLRQEDVADATGMKQSAISRIEKSEYSRWNFQTLLRIAQALDARVRVIFEPAEQIIGQYEAAEKAVARSTSADAFRQQQEEQAREMTQKAASDVQALAAARRNREQQRAAPTSAVRERRVNQ